MIPKQIKMLCGFIYLRKKLAALDANVAIKAVRNRGYALEAVND